MPERGTRPPEGENITQEIEKPPVLYHASSRNSIERFEPQVKKVRDPKEGPRVFATSDFALATVFILETDDSWTQSGVFSDTPYIVIAGRERFEALDRGGTIYTLPSDTFETDPTKGLGEKEWTSKDPVIPIEKKIYPAALEAMLENGVQVYFVDQKTLRNIQEADDHGLSILQGIQSENQRKGINVKEIK